MRFATHLTALMLVPLLAGGADAQEARYRLEKSGSGYVRMDTATGEMSVCEERSGELVCRLATDGRSGSDGDIGRLEDRIRALDERIDRLEASLAARQENSLPTEEEFEKTMGYMERFFRSFIGIVKELEEDEAKEPATPEGHKTSVKRATGAVAGRVPGRTA